MERHASVAGGLFRGVFGVLLPAACAHCGAPGGALCGRCAHGAVRGFSGPACPRCGGPAGGVDPVCAFCRTGLVETVTAAAPYVDPWKRWLTQAKFGPAPALADAMCARLVVRLAEAGLAGEAWLVPVPRGNRAGVLRGPSLPWRIAGFLERAGFGRRTGAIERRRPGRPQRLGGRASRAALGPDDFECVVSDGRPPALLLIDDVMTTGATLAAVAGACRARWPGVPVRAAVLARAGAPAGRPGAPDVRASEGVPW